VFAVLKKYNSVILDNFPENYMMTLETINKLHKPPIPVGMVEYLTTPSCFKAVNQRILEVLINLMIRTNRQDIIITILSIIKKIIVDFDSNAVLKRFENGWSMLIKINRNLCYIK